MSLRHLDNLFGHSLSLSYFIFFHCSLFFNSVDIPYISRALKYCRRSTLRLGLQGRRRRVISPAINHGVQREVDNFSYRVDGTRRDEEWSRRVGELARAHAHPKVGAGERRSCKSVVGGCWRRGCAPSGHKFPSKSRSKRQLPAWPRVKWRKASEKARRGGEPLPLPPPIRPSSLISRLIAPREPSRFSRANVASISASVSFSDPITGDYVEMI